MPREIELSLHPSVGFDNEKIQEHILNLLNETAENCSIRLLRRSIDARKKEVKINIKAEVYINETSPKLFKTPDYLNVRDAKPVIIVGAGPAGLFAALSLLELGMKPILIERGKDVRERRRDLMAINRLHLVNPDSNYCFGEGGAGTYSDGKLYTRSDKRGNTRRVLELLVHHGANENILVEAHPHIGTNKLPALVSELSNTITSFGGEIHFNTRLTSFIMKDGGIKGVVDQNGISYEGVATILATGHSARDIFKLLEKEKISIEAKPFAMGIRIEHPQEVIDEIQYHDKTWRKYLPSASYSLVCQAPYQGVNKGVFSFCMCPGGFIVPSATSPGEIVVNGMSPSRRDSYFSNSGIVMSIDMEDMKPWNNHGNLAGLQMQMELEQKACTMSGNKQTAPAQRMTDFLANRLSPELNKTSYQPGLKSVQLSELLYASMNERLKYALTQFGKTMRGYLTNEAQLVGVESRTSSPVRIPRDKTTCEHIQMKRLFPCGEGAGYAGGIVSAAMDGIRCAENIVKLYS